MENSRKKLQEDTALVDRISDLPDSILCHILSNLPTKEVVATSILSRRWEVLWTYVGTLKFDNFHTIHPNDGVPEKMQFSQFVHGVLHLLRTPHIKRMVLCCNEKGCNEYDAVSWIRTAISRNVEYLFLLFNFNFKWPTCLFYSQTLVHLGLFSVDFTKTNIPTAPFFPNLQKLVLVSPKYDTHSLQRFVSGCSNLKYLSIWVMHDFVETCYFSSSTLDTFDLRCCHANGEDLKVVLDTPALELLTCWTLKPVKLDLQVGCHDLTKVEIETPQYSMDLLRHFMEKANNLKDITFVKTACLIEGGAVWDEPHQVPKCLLSSLEKICIKGYENEEEVESMIKYILCNASILKRMIIHTSDSLKNNYELKFHMLQKITLFPKASAICQISLF